MENEVVYNIPAKLIGAYRGRNLIVRSETPREIVDSLSLSDLAQVRFVQLLSTPADTSDLEGWGDGIPIDVVLRDPPAEFARLYNYSNLLDAHPVRVSIPVVPGFSKAAKLAVSLSFAVKLELDQPDRSLIEELTRVLNLYLHRANVNQPIEFFHTMLLSFYQQRHASLWEIAEEDPSRVRYVMDDGSETISRRFDGSKLESDLEGFVERFAHELLAEKRECHDCEFFSRCGGYFKWPDRSYSCAGIRQLFSTLASAADEVKEDLAGYRATEVASQP
jgi:hypothetical protein